MNTYDPADYIVYVSMDRQHRPSVVGRPSDLAANRLPEGYANASPKTRLRRAAVQPSPSEGQAAPGPLPAPLGSGAPTGLRLATGMA